MRCASRRVFPPLSVAPEAVFTENVHLFSQSIYFNCFHSQMYDFSSSCVFQARLRCDLTQFAEKDLEVQTASSQILLIRFYFHPLSYGTDSTPLLKTLHWFYLFLLLVTTIKNQKERNRCLGKALMHLALISSVLKYESEKLDAAIIVF